MLNPQLSLNCRGRLLSLDVPIVMGILNITPDSFFSGSRIDNLDSLLKLAEKMLKEGATILDIGGMSSRPGANIIPLEEELLRVIPAIEAIHQRFPEAFISIDTIRAEVARKAVNAGASIINDISAGKLDEQMFPTVADLNVPYILMHMKGRPENMQELPSYEDVSLEILDFFIEHIARLRALNVKDIILDPGFGFGKTVKHNFRLLKELHIFKVLDLPLLAGISRKSMICKALKVNPPAALNGTTALHMVALQQGSHILRAHDVKEANEVIQLWQELESV
ncbi:MAG: dihydropteroate synthase [Saprospiraceae bacterium]|nr:MAG: dihydropteroate synthase [Saprospiraceae bacterium]